MDAVSVLVLATCLGADPGLPAAGHGAEPAPSESTRFEPDGSAYDGPAIAEMPPRSADEMRAAYHAAVRRAADRRHPDPFVVVPELVEVYLSLERPAGLPHAEASGMRRAVRLRLETFRDRLIRKRNEEAKARARDAARRARGGRREADSATASEASLAGGGAVAARAQELIELIQNTIEPDSWDVNGGRGRIRFFPQLNVLVIRATGEVHHQIGGTLGTLRK